MATEHDVLDRLEKLTASATPGPWTRTKPGNDESGWPMGVVIGGTPGRQTIYANHPGGSFPHADCELIIALRNAAPALIRLARAAITMSDKCDIQSDDPDVLFDFDAAIKELGEVRL